MPTKDEERTGEAQASESREAGLMKWNRNRGFLAAAGAAVVGLGAALVARRWWSRPNGEDVPAAAHSGGTTAPGPVGQSGAARPAGPDAMRDPPEQWEKVDQSSDKSFPASDPPGISPKVD